MTDTPKFLDLKVTHFAKYFPPEYGGIETVTRDLVCGTHSYLKKVRVVSFTNDKSGSPHSNDGTFELYRCRSLAVIKSQPISFRYFFLCVLFGWRSHIVHIHTPNILACLAVLFISPFCKVILHWHADIAHKGIMYHLVSLFVFLTKWRASAIVYTSENYLQHSPGASSFRAKSSVIPIGIPSKTMADPLKRTANELLFVGRLVHYKGLDVLIKSLSHVKNSVTLKIVGVGPERQKLSALLDSVPERHTVKFLGKVSNEELGFLFNNAGLFCLPSRNRLEAFGVVLLEAMRVGCPTVSSRIEGSGINWVNESGLSFENGDARDLALQIDYFLDDSSLRFNLGSDNKLRFEELFHVDRMCFDFITIYEAITIS